MNLKKKHILYLIVTLSFLLVFKKLNKPSNASLLKYELEKYLQEPVIFIGGFVSSGTSLMRSILDVHPDVKCGPELKLTYSFLESLKELFENPKSKKTLHYSEKIQLENIEKAAGLLIFYLYINNVPNAIRVCNKEPGNIAFIDIYKRVFPNSKFIYIVRDGREAAYSWVKRNKNAKFKSFYMQLIKWNFRNKQGYRLCLNAGSNYCKIVRYENLVTKPRETIEEIANFLDLEWTEKFLKHQDYLRKDIKLSKIEHSLYGIKNEINNKSIGNWIGKFEDYDEKLIEKNIDMLKVFAYLN